MSDDLNEVKDLTQAPRAIESQADATLAPGPDSPQPKPPDAGEQSLTDLNGTTNQGSDVQNRFDSGTDGAANVDERVKFDEILSQPNLLKAARPNEGKEERKSAQSKPDAKAEEAPRDLKESELQKIEEVCVLPPQSYEVNHDSSIVVFVVYGPEGCGKYTCAVRFGLDLISGTSHAPLSDRGILTAYRIGLNRLLNQIVRGNSDRSKFDTLQQRLTENLDKTERYGDQPANHAERAELIEQLTGISNKVLGLSFLQLCVSSSYVARSHIKLFLRSPRDSRTLIEYIQHPSLQKDDVCIVEGALINDFDPAEASDELLNLVKSRGLRLILTVTHRPDQIEQLPSWVGRINAYVEDELTIAGFMNDVLENHLRYYRESLAKEDRDRTLKLLNRPRQIDEFCHQLRQLPLDSNQQRRTDLAAEIAGYSDSRYLGAWFHSLGANAKLYAMLVTLFGDLNYQILNEFYFEAVKRLRQDGMRTLSDPRQFGFNDILRDIHASEKAQLIRFTDSAFELEARRQIGNFRHMLWSLMGMWLEIIENYRAPKHWEFRRALGIAIGQLGQYYLTEQGFSPFAGRLEGLLDGIAYHESGGVVAVAGYALDELCRTSPDNHTFVIDLLKRWTESGDPDLKWAAASAVWRIYDGLARTAHVNDLADMVSARAARTLEQAQAILNRLAETFNQFGIEARRKARMSTVSQEEHDNIALSDLVDPTIAQRIKLQLDAWAVQNANAILHAVRWIAASDAKYVVRQIKQWLESKTILLAELGQSASLLLFEESSAPEIHLLTEAHEPLLELIGPLLRTHQDIVDDLMRSVLEWVKWPGWMVRVHEALLATANRATEPEARRLIRAISTEWLGSDRPDACRIGQAVIARATAIIGLPMDLPEKCVALTIDASQARSFNRLITDFGRELAERLATQVDIRVFRLGESKVLAGEGQMISTGELLSDHARPRLLLPVLEQMDRDKLHFAVALSAGTIIDLEDVSSTNWLGRVLVASARSISPSPSDGVEFIAISWNDLDSALQSIDAAVQIRLARTLESRTADLWWPVISKYVQFSSTDRMRIQHDLQSWITQLDSVESSYRTVDLMRVIVCAILWLAVSDLQWCVDILRDWLNDADNSNVLTLQRSVGTACAKALFRLKTYAEPVPAIGSHLPLFELIPVLARRDWSSVEVVLEAARHWAIQPEWLRRLLTHPAGIRSELFELVFAIGQADSQKLVNLLTSWSQVPEEKQMSESVARLRQSLLIQSALRLRQPLPDLPEGRTYCLVVVDAMTNGRSVQNGLEELGAKIIKVLTDDYKEKLLALGYHLGQDAPTTSQIDNHSLDTFTAPECRPVLLGPILETHIVSRVSLVILLSNQPILDLEDWRNTSWSNRVLHHSRTNQQQDTPFVVMPKMSVSDEFDFILRFIKQTLGV